MVTPNHPAGIADGIAVYQALKRVRSDLTFLANRDAIRICPGFAELIVPVEWLDIGEAFDPDGDPEELAKSLRRFVVYGMRRGRRRYPGLNAPGSARGTPFPSLFYPQLAMTS